MNLLQKLNEKLKSMNKNDKLVRKLASVSMAGIMMATLAGCTPSDANVDPDHNQQQSEQTLKEYSMYSTTLQHALASEEFTGYKDTIYNWNGIDHAEPIPYGFLEKEGFNKQEIKLNRLDDLRTNLFVLDKKLYIMLSFPMYTTDLDYYREYLLSYSLTDHELKDLDFLASKNNIYFDFFIQQLSYDKTAKLENLALISIETKNESISQIHYSFINHNKDYKYYSNCSALYLDQSNRTGSKNYKNLKFLVLNNQYDSIDENYQIQKYTRTMSIGNFKSSIANKPNVFTEISGKSCLLSIDYLDVENDQFENSNDEFGANEKTVLTYRDCNYANANYDFTEGYGDFIYEDVLT